MLLFSDRCPFRASVAGIFVAVSIGAIPVLVDQAAAAPGDWTLTKTANPTAYSAAGQVINYTYVITNHTGGTGLLFSFTDDKAAPVTCPSTTVPPNGTLTCTATYTTTALDVAGGNITNHATAIGDSCGEGCNVTAQAQATVTFRAPPPPATGSITIVKTATGGNDTFNFTSSIPGAGSFALATGGGTATRVFSNLPAGTYTVSEVNLPLNWNLSTLTCVGDTGGTPTTTNLAGRTASIGLDGGEAITCTFGNVFDVAQHGQQTQDVIARFLSHRVQLLASDEPDRNRLIRRLPGSLWGDDGQSASGSGAGGALSFSGQTDVFSSRMSFTTSTSRIAQAHEDARAKDDLQDVMAYARPVKAPERPLAPAPGVDVWVEVHASAFNASTNGTDSRGHFGIVYLGADYLVTPWLLVGALVQYDWMGEQSQALALAPASAVNGQGVMAGPYVSARLTPNIFVDARAAWGLSDNKVNPFGQYQDGFSTNRWLASGNLTGNWYFGNFRVTPSAGVTYVQETQLSYTDSLGVVIPAQTVSLGRFSVGPEFAYRYLASQGMIFEPMVSFKGVWDFQKPDVSSVNGLIVGTDDVHAKVQAGVLARAPNGISLRTVFSYDGVGSSRFHDIGGQVWLNVPLQWDRH